MADGPDWHAEDVKAAVRKTGVTLADLSRRWGYAPYSVQVALRRPWPEIEALIAAHLHRHPWTIWPSRYDAKHKPLTRRYTRRPKIKKETVAHSNERGTV